MPKAKGVGRMVEYASGLSDGQPETEDSTLESEVFVQLPLSVPRVDTIRYKYRNYFEHDPLYSALTPLLSEANEILLHIRQPHSPMRSSPLLLPSFLHFHFTLYLSIPENLDTS